MKSYQQFCDQRRQLENPDDFYVQEGITDLVVKPIKGALGLAGRALRAMLKTDGDGNQKVSASKPLKPVEKHR
jgi:hypothetical protein